MSTAAEYLESLQRAHGMDPEKASRGLRNLERRMAQADFEDHFVGMPGGEDQEAMREFVAQSLKEAEETKPTPFEDAGNYVLMLGLSRRVKAAADRAFPNSPEIPLFGTLPIGRLNAMAIRVPGSNEYLIVFQEGVFGFANLFVKAVVASLPVDIDDDGALRFGHSLRKVEALWEEDDQPLHRLEDLLASYLIVGHPHAAEQYFLDGPRYALVGVLVNAFETFIFGHEFGHIFSGHLKPDEATNPMKLGPTEVEKLSPSWKMEIEADFVGLILTMHVLREEGFDPATSYWGVDLAFSAMQLLEKARTTLLHGAPSEMPATSSHPPPQVRRTTSHIALEIIFGKERAEEARQLASGSEELIEAMWTRLRPSFEEKHLRGLRPQSVWQ